MNAAGETALFRAVQFGNLTWTRILLQREANPFLSFVPSTRHKSHAERYRHVYAVCLIALISDRKLISSVGSRRSHPAVPRSAS